MGVDMDLDFDKQCRVGLSPKTVLPSNRHCSNIENNRSRRRSKLTRRDELLSIEEDFTEITFTRYRSASCKSIPSTPVGLEGHVEVKRGSVYESSSEVRKMKKMGINEGRRKIEPRSSDTSFPFRVVDTLGSSDEESMNKKRSSVISLNSDLNRTPCSSDGFFEIRLNLDNREKSSTETVERDSIEDPNLKCDEVLGPRNDGNELLERDTCQTLHKSLSAKAEHGHSRASHQKARFSPLRKMFDPFTKSKSLKSPLGYATEHGEVKTNRTADIRKNGTFRKSLLHDFSNTEQILQSESHLVKKEKNHSVVPCLPTHLRGCLKLENKHGVPFFEFSLKYPEEVFIAKTWKVDNAFNWVYTFYSVHSRKKSNAYGGRGSKDSNKESSTVGQMQVSCYLCSEQKYGAFDNSMVTEFVLYDIAHARKSVAAQESSNCTPEITNPAKGANESSAKETQELDVASDPLKLKHQTPYPWPPADLHPDHEIGAIVIQVPFEKRESLKYKSGDRISDIAMPDLLDYSVVGQKKKDIIPVSISPPKMSVVTPSGNHGLSNAKSQGPSSLLDRWRLGGGCDCGGWDMACPLTVFCNSNNQTSEDRSFMECQRLLEIYAQGTKENTPALTITTIEEGQYTVDFHARLSTLQAFSICVAILHSSEASTAVGKEGNRQLLECNSLKVLIEEEVKFLIEAVTGEEKKKTTEMKKRNPDLRNTDVKLHQELLQQRLLSFRFNSTSLPDGLT